MHSDSVQAIDGPDGGPSRHAAQRSILRAAAGRDGVRGVVAEAGRLVGGWAAYVDVRGTVIEISYQGFAKQAQDWAMRLVAQAVQPHTGLERESLFSEQGDREYCTDAVLGGADGGVAGAVVLSAAGDSGDSDDSGDGVRGSCDEALLRSTARAAADALTVLVPRLEASYRRVRRLRAACLTSMRDGNGAAVLTLAEELWRHVPLPPLRLVCVDGDSQALEDLYGSLDRDDHALADVPKVFGEYDRRLWLLVAADDAHALEQGLAAVDGVEFGSCDCPSWQTLPGGFAKAVQDMHLRRLGLSGRSFADMSVIELIRPDLAVAYAEELLKPLSKLPSTEAAALLDSAKTLLVTAFNIGEAAKRLGVHRHTVENRLSKLEGLLGIDLSQESARVCLWIACSFLSGR